MVERTLQSSDCLLTVNSIVLRRYCVVDRTLKSSYYLLIIRLTVIPLTLGDPAWLTGR